EQSLLKMRLFFFSYVYPLLPLVILLIEGFFYEKYSIYAVIFQGLPLHFVRGVQSVEGLRYNAPCIWLTIR
ncbi:hypothetical protein, partial [Ruminococcus sp.]|uniref:hypothetical protein n=1 Tax=Ruminococcus sp. TaxID=41978 RepID=UPI003F0F2CA0